VEAEISSSEEEVGDCVVEEEEDVFFVDMEARLPISLASSSEIGSSVASSSPSSDDDAYKG